VLKEKNILSNLERHSLPSSKRSYYFRKMNIVTSIDSVDKFEEAKLPARDAFFNHLANEPLSEERYKHAQDVWRTFNMNPVGDYHDLYVNSDALLLCDIFECFREMTAEILFHIVWYTGDFLILHGGCFAQQQMTIISLQIMHDDWNKGGWFQLQITCFTRCTPKITIGWGVDISFDT
jgi:hypothetical protein